MIAPPQDQRKQQEVVETDEGLTTHGEPVLTGYVPGAAPLDGPIWFRPGARDRRVLRRVTV